MLLACIAAAGTACLIVIQFTGLRPLAAPLFENAEAVRRDGEPPALSSAGRLVLLLGLFGAVALAAATLGPDPAPLQATGPDTPLAEAPSAP